MVACPNCGEQSPDRARFCMACGAPLGSAAPVEQRRIVTIVFSDLVGSTALGERMDPEAYRGVLTQYFDVVRGALEGRGGVLEKFIGDAVMAVFGLPRAHEDDALRACQAVLDVQAALRDFNDRLEETHGLRLAVRTGVHTGEVVSGDPSSGQRLVTGDAVNTAARLEQACPEMAILIGQPTYDLVRHQVETEPFEPIGAKGKAAPLHAHRLIAVRGPVHANGAGASRSSLVGREEELRMLTDAWLDVRRASRCRLLAVVGDPGMGKTRLVNELVARVDSEASVLRGGCLHYGQGITYGALASAFRSLVGLADTDRGELLVQRLCDEVDPSQHASVRLAAVGMGAIDGEIDTASSHAALVRLLAALARKRPLLLVIDDVHWAESALLELLLDLPTKLAQAQVLVVCGARPELLTRPEWSPGRDVEMVSFKQLSSRSVGALVRHTLGSDAAESLVAAVDAAAGGNPLFVEQMLALWVERGLVERGATGWMLAPGADAAVVVPPTVTAIVTARLDRLAERDAAVARRASVVGHVFSSQAVEALSTPPEDDSVAPSLVRLSQAQLVQGSETAGHLEGWSFSHVLVRDAAYAGLLKRDRSALHERCADWIATLDPSHELADIAAYHCEQAFQYAADLGARDQRVRRLQSRATDELAASGRRALRRGALASAAGWLERALAVAERDDPRRTALLTDLGTALSELGQRQRSRSLLEEAMALAEDLGDVSARWRARRPLLEIDASDEQMEAEAREHLALLEPLGDDAGLARAWRIIALAAWNRGRIEESFVLTKVALSHAIAAAEETEARDIRAALPALALGGTTSVPAALRLTGETLAEVADSLRARGFVLISMAALRLMDDDPAAARQAWTEAQSALREGGIQRWDSFLTRVLAEIDVADGNVDLAIANLSASTEDTKIAPSVRGWIAAQLVHVLLDVGRNDEAAAYERLVRQTDRQFPEDWTLAVSALARLAAQRGDHDDASRLAREAVDVLEGTDLLDPRALALQRSAEVARTLGDHATWMTNLHRALELFELKGNRRAARTVRAALPPAEVPFDA